MSRSMKRTSAVHIRWCMEDDAPAMMTAPGELLIGHALKGRIQKIELEESR